MIFDSLCLAASIAELRPALTGLTIHQVRQPSDLEIVFVCRRAGYEQHLLLSADARFARCHLTSIRRPSPKTPPGFCQLLRKHLQGSRLESVEQAGVDRITRYTFITPEGDRPCLIHEIMGKHSNIILTTSDDRILGAIKMVGPRQSRVRQILPGRDYSLPPSSKISPTDLSCQLFVSMWENASATGEVSGIDQAVKWLVSRFDGISPVLAREIAHRAQPFTPQGVYESLTGLFALFETLEFHPVILHHKEKGYEEVYPIPLTSLPDVPQYARPILWEALDSAVRAEMDGLELHQQKTNLEKSLERALDQIARQIAEAEEAIANPDEVTRLREQADILAANFHLLKNAGSEITLPNYYDPEMGEITIALRPDYAPQQNIDRAFHKARKAEDRIAQSQRRLPELNRRYEEMDFLLQEVIKASSLEEIKRLVLLASEAGISPGGQEVLTAKGEEDPLRGRKIRVTTSKEGWEILVGESAEANDYLTTKVARPTDIWLHARAVTGAHVIIRTGGRSNVPKDTLLEAARLAASHSDARHSSYIPVDYTLRKFVRKPRRSAPGFVTYTHEKTIHIQK